MADVSFEVRKECFGVTNPGDRINARFRLAVKVTRETVNLLGVENGVSLKERNSDVVSPLVASFYSER